MKFSRPHSRYFVCWPFFFFFCSSSPVWIMQNVSALFRRYRADVTLRCLKRVLNRRPKVATDNVAGDSRSCRRTSQSRRSVVEVPMKEARRCEGSRRRSVPVRVCFGLLGPSGWKVTCRRTAIYHKNLVRRCTTARFVVGDSVTLLRHRRVATEGPLSMPR